MCDGRVPTTSGGLRIHRSVCGAWLRRFRLCIHGARWSASLLTGYPAEFPRAHLLLPAR
jgi:hypothetical protein